jgi:hypothetical protein
MELYLFLLHGIHRNNFTFQIQSSLTYIVSSYVPHLGVCPKTQYTVLSQALIFGHNAEVFFELLSNHDKDLTLKHLVEIQKQSTPD